MSYIYNLLLTLNAKKFIGVKSTAQTFITKHSLDTSLFTVKAVNHHGLNRTVKCGTLMQSCS